MSDTENGAAVDFDAIIERERVSLTRLKAEREARMGGERVMSVTEATQVLEDEARRVREAEHAATLEAARRQLVSEALNLNYGIDALPKEQIRALPKEELDELITILKAERVIRHRVNGRSTPTLHEAERAKREAAETARVEATKLAKDEGHSPSALLLAVLTYALLFVVAAPIGDPRLWIGASVWLGIGWVCAYQWRTESIEKNAQRIHTELMETAEQKAARALTALHPTQ